MSTLSMTCRLVLVHIICSTKLLMPIQTINILHILFCPCPWWTPNLYNLIHLATNKLLHHIVMNHVRTRAVATLLRRCTTVPSLCDWIRTIPTFRQEDISISNMWVVLVTHVQDSCHLCISGQTYASAKQNKKI